MDRVDQAAVGSDDKFFSKTKCRQWQNVRFHRIYIYSPCALILSMQSFKVQNNEDIDNEIAIGVSAEI